jgi:glycosyltransferase involved in cell wall biosynthesis
MGNGNPAVSVCIPTYNRAGMLKEAVEAVLAQTFRDFELIVSDNASTDETGSVMKLFDDPRIRYVKNERNIGHRENWNQCLSLARGEYIALIPDDDRMMPDNLHAKMEMFARHPNVGLVHSKYHVIDEHGNITQRNVNRGPQRHEDAVEHGYDLLPALLQDNVIHESTVMFRRACYDRLGGFSRRLAFAFDYEFWMRIAAYYDVGFVAKPLVKWRRHSGMLTKSDFSTSGSLGESAYRDTWKAIALFVRQYAKAAPNRQQIRKVAWRRIIGEAFAYASRFPAKSGERPLVRSLVWELCRTYPEILLDKAGWAMLIESLLSPGAFHMLRRLYGKKAWS